MQNDQLVAGLYLDLSRAFDSLNHEILFHKLQCIGIRGFVLEWVKSFLSNRRQFTIVNQAASSDGYVKFGVPQGSVLGPLLFIIYINDIAKIPNQKFFPRLFADDTNIFVYAKNVSDLKSQSQQTLNSISSWFLANRLTINIAKTCYMVFSPHKNISIPNDFTLTINSLLINKVDHTKFLGVIIDDKLSWKEHISAILAHLRRFVGIFYKISFFVPRSILKMLYFSLVHSKIIYAIEL